MSSALNSVCTLVYNNDIYIQVYAYSLIFSIDASPITGWYTKKEDKREQKPSSFAFLLTTTYTQEVHTYRRYIQEIHTYRRYIHTGNTYIQEVHTYRRYIQEIHTYRRYIHTGGTYRRYIHTGGTYIQEVHTYRRYIIYSVVCGNGPSLGQSTS